MPLARLMVDQISAVKIPILFKGLPETFVTQSLPGAQESDQRFAILPPFLVPDKRCAFVGTVAVHTAQFMVKAITKGVVGKLPDIFVKAAGGVTHHLARALQQPGQLQVVSVGCCIHKLPDHFALAAVVIPGAPDGDGRDWVEGSIKLIAAASRLMVNHLLQDHMDDFIELSLVDVLPAQLIQRSKSFQEVHVDIQ